MTSRWNGYTPDRVADQAWSAGHERASLPETGSLTERASPEKRR
jgi:hypothetical protein